MTGRLSSLEYVSLCFWLIFRLAQVHEDFLLQLDVVLETLDAVVMTLVLFRGLLDSILGKRLFSDEAKVRFLWRV